MKRIILMVCFLASFQVFADGGSSPSSVTSPQRWGVYGTYSYLDTWLPGKWGVTGVYNWRDADYELAFQQASYSFDFVIDDLGSISDTRIHLSRRSYVWDGSFNVNYGVYYNSLAVTLGKSYLGVVDAKFNVVSVATAGVMGAIGNRWIGKSGFSYGVDWLKIFYPLTEVSRQDEYLKQGASEENKKNVEDLLDTIASIPTLSLLHIELGYRF